MKEDRVLFMELKSYSILRNPEYNDAFKQLVANEDIVKDFLKCTK
jgi:hypothetical protein